MKGCMRGHRDSVLEAARLLSTALHHQNTAVHDDGFVNAAACFCDFSAQKLTRIHFATETHKQMHAYNA